MQYQFTRDQLQNFEDNISREWALTNGIGGYAGSSILGAHNRTHQGYLIASLHPPVERYVVFSKTNEIVRQQGNVYDLTTAQHAGEACSDRVVEETDLPEEYKRADTVSVAADFVARKPIYTRGNQYLESFGYDGTVCFTYQAGDLTIEKRLALVQGENTAALSYEIKNAGENAELTIVPLMNFREHSCPMTEDDILSQLSAEGLSMVKGCGFVVTSKQQKEFGIQLLCSAGSLEERQDQVDRDIQLQTEVINETPGLDSAFTPYEIKVGVAARSTLKLSLMVRVLPKDQCLVYSQPESGEAAEAIRQVKAYLDGLIAQAGFEKNDLFANTLVVAANQFLCHRQSTGLKTVLAGLPWFTDWGRDTMIAFTGLTLVTKRYQEAAEILKTFAMYVHHGMVPNMFPDDGLDPLYNTADASLWYFYAVDQYLNYVKTEEAADFIRKEIYPALKEIMEAYQKGTDFSIYMEEDGLIHAGSGVDQVTWMDVRVGDWVVTPRHGKPVEINALWYNALCVMEKLAQRFGEDGKPYATLADKVKESFLEEFWYQEGGYLYDVVDGENKDASLRPNQIYAVSLPYTMLPADKARSVVLVVADKLYAKRGIRSLSPDHQDYHPIYIGSLPKRDAAYHQGTAWGFLMGGFITAFLKVYDHSPEAVVQAMDYLLPVKEHLMDGCIGSISEIFDGDAPHIGRGCYAQAWSVGEVLRCYAEDILAYI